MKIHISNIDQVGKKAGKIMNQKLFLSGKEILIFVLLVQFVFRIGVLSSFFISKVHKYYIQ